MTVLGVESSAAGALLAACIKATSLSTATVTQAALACILKPCMLTEKKATQHACFLLRTHGGGCSGAHT